MLSSKEMKEINSHKKCQKDDYLLSLEFFLACANSEAQLCIIIERPIKSQTFNLSLTNLNSALPFGPANMSPISPAG